MTDEELIARLRKYKDDLLSITADRIKALVNERDEALEWLSASQGYIADAVFALDKQEKAEAERDALRAERDASNELGRAFEEDAGQQRERAEAAEAERDTLRAELDKWMERCGRERAFASSHRIRAEAAEAKVEKLRGAGDGLHSIVEGIQGAMQHGTWRDEKGQRLKDTPEWVAFYNARAAITEATQ